MGAGGGGTALREPERRCHYSLVPARVCFSNFTKLKAVDCGMFWFLMWLLRARFWTRFPQTRTNCMIPQQELRKTTFCSRSKLGQGVLVPCILLPLSNHVFLFGHRFEIQPRFRPHVPRWVLAFAVGSSKGLLLIWTNNSRGSMKPESSARTISSIITGQVL